MDGSVSAWESSKKIFSNREIKLAPYGVEVWTTASDAEARKIAEGLKKIAGFKAGNLLSSFGTLAPHNGDSAGLDFSTASGRGVKGEKEMLTITGNGKSTLQYKVKMSLKKGKSYMLKAQIRKDKGANGYMAVANYSAKKNLKFYGGAGASIPDDGQWHEVAIKISADDELYNCGLFIYNQKSIGDISVNKISLKEL